MVFSTSQLPNSFSVVSSLITSCIEGANEAGTHSSLCAHIETKCEAVEIDLWIAYFLNQIHTQNNLYYLAYSNIPHQYLGPHLMQGSIKRSHLLLYVAVS